MKITEYRKYYDAPPKNPKVNKSADNSKASNMFDWVQSVVVAIVALFVLFVFVLRPVRVEGESMLPTLQDGDWLLLSAFDFEPEYGEIVVVTQPNQTRTGEPIIKRVIATEGQQVDIDFEQGIVYVDGKTLTEPYIKELTYRPFDVTFPLTVPEGCVFVMGDNRNDSLDSRSTRIGFVDERYVLGSVKLRLFPFEPIKYRTGVEE